ncbi:hypothetical protein MKX03_026992 [Papaver bracteatum]|nr:hypothetical protein MKX03_026992 [Papaver bracteatum]
MVTVEEIRNAQRAEGPANVLAIGTATPANCVLQADYPDYYFKITKSEHMTDLKEKFKRMCEKSQIRKRYMHITEEILNENPNMCEYLKPNRTVMHLAKDLAENNAGARVLVVYSLVGQALFGDGAGAMIIGADPDISVERPLFQIVSAAQTILPDSHGVIDGHLREVGLTFHLLKDEFIINPRSKNIEKSLYEAFKPIGITDWNSLFWIAHPGGPEILDQVEAKLGLKEEKLRATRHVLSEYGNMSSACVLFILDEMRKKSLEEGKSTTGDGLEWGVLFGFGPGLTVETVVLHSIPTTV